jgi:ABC-2 type transport system permease protein
MNATITTPTQPSTGPAPARPPSPSPGRQLAILARALLRGFVRDRTALLFTFVFPLMFLAVFGLLFRSGADPTSIGVVGAGPVVSSLPPDVFAVQRFDSLDAAVAKVRSGDLPAVVAQQGDTILLRYAASDQVTSATIRGIIGAVVARANLAATGQQPRFGANFRQVEAADTRPIQYLTPGILSWGVATSAVFGAALTLVTWRRKQLLRRLRLSPAPAWTILGARVGVSLVVALAQAALFIGVALTPPFGLRLSHHWWLAIPLLLVGTLSYLSIGLLVGAIAKTEEAAQAMANLVVLPMAFLSGSFFADDEAGALGAQHRKDRAGDVHRAEQGGLDLRPEVPRGDLLEEPGVEVAGVVDQHVEAAEPLHGSRDGRLGVGGVVDVELDDQQVLVRSKRRADPLGVASGGDHGVTGTKGGLGDVDAHPAPRAGDEPHLLVRHASALPFRFRVWSTLLSAVHLLQNQPAWGPRRP